MLRLASLLLLALLFPPSGLAQEEPERAALERAFAETMSGAVLVGHFSDDTAPPGAAPSEERYTLGQVSKSEDGRWRFEAQVEYGGRSFPVALVLDVEWAGDTPVITMTDRKIPLVGTFTVRLLVYRDQYAGTWSGGDHGGHMWGRIERAAAEPEPEDDAGDDDDDGYVHWPSFRGPNASGVAAGGLAVTSFDVESGEGVRWRTPIPGLCHSSPVIWGERLLVTTAVKEGEPAMLRVGLYGDTQPVEDESVHEYRVLCLDKRTGEVLWDELAWQGVPAIKRHPKGSHVASTPATDGRYVACFFGSEGLYCYTAGGELVWKKDLGRLESGWFMNRDPWGFASSPAIFEDRVIVQCDVLNGSFVAAYRLADGEELWRTERDEVPGWGSPTVDVRPGRRQVILNGYKHMGGYDVDTGAELWKLGGGGDVPVPTPIVAHDLVYITNAHGLMAPIYAIDALAEGVLSREHEALVWHETRRGNYMQTPLVLGDHLYLCADNGALACRDARSGEELYRERLGEGRSGFTASMVAADGKLYATSEEGDVYVVREGPRFEVVGEGRLGEEAMASPAVSEGAIYWRTRGHVVAIGGTESE